jgi:serine/threonine protein kinase
MPTGQWPSSRDYVEAVQNPALAFQDPDLKAATPALDRLGMPFVTSGQFAYVFKLNTADGKAQAVRCFRGSVPDREDRYQKIDDHLDKVSAPCFVSFEYDAQGIMTGGKRYPIQVMEWIGGFPLDVYLPNVLGRKDMLKFLAEQWLKALATLRDGGMAHGDLQHGNVIVDESNSLRLVDLDGMYVPSMAGRKASELGHRHYQHPKRSADHFDARLDNFSGLVIYLSLIALAEQPDLWKEFHDENLIFIKTDFENPRTSKLLSKIKTMGGECQPLAEALEKACHEDPLRCPSVLELVDAAPSKLPAWMVTSPAVTVQQATREVKPGQAPPPPVSSAIPLPSSHTSPGQPWYTTAPANVTIPVSTPYTQGATTVQITPRDVARHTVTYAFMGIFLSWLWFPLLRLFFAGTGATSQAAPWLAVFTYLAACILLAYRRTQKEAKPHVATSQPVGWTPAPPISTSRPAPAYSSYSTRSKASGSSASTAPRALVGSKIRMIYHKPSCKWAIKISPRNRVSFSSEADAKGRGYRPCSVCSP